MNAIPKTKAALITLALRVLEGARSDAGADLAQNTAARLAPEL